MQLFVGCGSAVLISVNFIFFSRPRVIRSWMFSWLSFGVLTVSGQSFEQKVIALPSSEGTYSQWIDADGDEDLDVMAFTSVFETGQTYFALYRNDDGQLARVADFLTGDNDDFVYHGYIAGDYDNDGDIDFLLHKFGAVDVAINNGDLTFTRKSTGVVSTNSSLRNWIDIDGDADLDIILTNATFINSGGSYIRSNAVLPLTDYSLGFWLDLNSDGLLDLISAKALDFWNDALIAYVNKGNLVFGDPVELSTNFDGMCMVRWLDADGDHDLDLLISERDRTWHLIKNTLSESGTLSFSRAFSLGTFTNSPVAISDLDLDGLPDLVMTEDVNSILSFRMYRNASAGGIIKFTKGDELATAKKIRDVQVIDLNHDNTPDVFYGGTWESGGFAAVLLNTLTPIKPSPVSPINLKSLVTESVKLSWDHDNNGQVSYYNIQINKDGKIYKPALTFSDESLMNYGLTRLNPSREFSMHGLPGGSYEWKVQAFDHAFRSSPFSASGSFEIMHGPENLMIKRINLTSAQLEWTYTYPGNPGFVIYRQTDGNEFMVVATLPSGTRTFSDINLPEEKHFRYYVRAIVDGVQSEPGNVVDFYSQHFVGATFNEQSPPLKISDGVVADFDSDGDYDLGVIGEIMGSIVTRIFTNDGAGKYTESSFLPDDMHYQTLAARDMDNDGDTDICILVRDVSHQRAMVFSNNAGDFSKIWESDQLSDAYQVFIEDFNHDGRADFMIDHSRYAETGALKVFTIFHQTLQGSFVASDIQFPEAGPMIDSKYYLSDFNNDTFTDVLISGSTGTLMYKNVSGHSFEMVSTSLPILKHPLLCDVNGDGTVDILHRNYPNVHQLLGDGTFHFAPPTDVNLEIGSNLSMKSADLDFNGWTDLIIDDEFRARIMNNKGFGNLVQSGFDFPVMWGNRTFLTDSDNDGDVDIVNIGDDSNPFTTDNFVFANQSRTLTLSNGAPSPPTSLKTEMTSTGVHFSWSASSDDRTPQGQISYNLWLTDVNGKVLIHPETDVNGTFRRRLSEGNAGYRNSYRMTGLPDGKYKLRVQAVDASFALSAWSDEIAFTIFKGPNNLTVQRVLLNKIELHWIDGPEAERAVVISRKSGNSEFEVIAELPSGTLSFVDADLAYEKKYAYHVHEVLEETITGSSNVVTWNTARLILAESDFPEFVGDIDIGDYTGDGMMDFIVSKPESSESVAYKNSATGWIAQTIGKSISQQFFRTYLEDVNGDRKLDVYRYSKFDHLDFRTETFLNNGGSSFTPSSNVFTTNMYDMLGWWDSDLDNDLDAYVGVNGLIGQSNILLKNKGAGQFETQVPMCHSCNATHNVFGDFDRDGAEDMIEPNGTGYWIKSNGKEGLRAVGIISHQYYMGSRGYPVDFNGDGWLDIVFISNELSNAKSCLYRNKGLNVNGTLIFEKALENLPGGENVDVTGIDFDHDGDTDLLINGQHPVIYENTGIAFQPLDLLLGSWQYNRPRWLDVDGDGDHDLIVPGKTSSRKVFINRVIDDGTGVRNLPPGIPVNLQAMQDSTGLYLEWTSGSDDHSSVSALTYDVVLYKDGNIISKGLLDAETGSRRKLLAGRNIHGAYLKTLRPGDYTWRVQAVDQSYSGSPLSEEGSFFFRPLPPAISSDTTIAYCAAFPRIWIRGENIEWFSDKETTIRIATGEFQPTQSQTVYVTHTVDGIRSLPRTLKITLVFAGSPPPPLLPVNPLAYCEDEAGFEATVTAIGESIEWYTEEGTVISNSSILVPTEDKNYYVTQTVLGCKSERDTLVVYGEKINTTVAYENGRLVVSEREGDFYQWFLQETVIPEANDYFYDVYEPGTYVVGVIKSRCIEFSEPFEIKKVNEQDELLPFPNPATSQFEIDMPVVLDGELTIIDSHGKIIVTKNSISNSKRSTMTVLCANWPAGVYNVILVDGGKRLVGRVFKK